MKKVFKEIVFICAISAIFAFAYHLLSENGLPLIYREVSLNAEEPLTVEDVYTVWLKKNAVFIDARSAEEFKAGHIKDAVNLPLESSRETKITFMNGYDKNSLFILYCSNPQCGKAEQLARQLKFMGYQNSLVFTEGITGWKEAGFDIETTGR